MEEAVIVLCELGEQRFALSLRVGRGGGRGGPV